MFFRICNLENCLNHKRIKQWPTRKKQKQIESNACDALRRWVKRLESVLRLFSRQLWIEALTFSSLLHPEASVCHGMCMAWRLLNPWLRDWVTALLWDLGSVPQEPSGNKLSQLPCETNNIFPSLMRISPKPKVQHLLASDFKLTYCLQKVVFCMRGMLWPLCVRIISRLALPGDKPARLVAARISPTPTLVPITSGITTDNSNRPQNKSNSFVLQYIWIANWPTRLGQT